MEQRVKERYEKWLYGDFDEVTKQELLTIAEDEGEIADRFYKDLDFGTGGLRGVLGAGTNRMNLYTVRKATQGLANFIIKEGKQKRGVAIAYDSRHMSVEFSEAAALCLNANGIKTYRFSSLRPTPELSFAVRELGCVAGIVITASHNPPEYNGYKVYWEDGAQITPPKDEEIIKEVNAVVDYAAVKSMDRERAQQEGLYHVIGEEIDARYMEELHKLVLRPDCIKAAAGELSIVYTPLHGTGNVPVRRILKELGFTKVYVVEEQEQPDGDFPTVSYPNPEDKKAFAFALKLAEEKNADLVLAIDPDADRLGVYAKDSKSGQYQAFTGNMSGLLIAEYILSQRKKQGSIPENGVLVKTIVSSNMAEEMAKAYNIETIDVLTGFKYIGEQIKFFEENKTHTYLFGYEESYGCLPGTYARDKDAIAAVMMLCEAAAYYYTRGMTLWDQMFVIYEKYGYYREDLATITLKGEDGAAKIQEILEKLRKSPWSEFGGLKTVALRDYKSGERIDLNTKEITSTGLPKSNVLYYELENHAWCCVRPSGTEPKVKFYMGVKGTSLAEADKQIATLKEALLRLGE